VLLLGVGCWRVAWCGRRGSVFFFWGSFGGLVCLCLFSKIRCGRWEAVFCVLYAHGLLGPAIGLD
jgi:hypothetical protein